MTWVDKGRGQAELEEWTNHARFGGWSYSYHIAAVIIAMDGQEVEMIAIRSSRYKVYRGLRIYTLQSLETTTDEIIMGSVGVVSFFFPSSSTHRHV